jgi:nucleotide-binding universal stress UspA family protein
LGHPFNGWSGPAAETWLIAPEHVAEHEEQMINDARTYLEGVAERLRGEHRNTVWEVRTGQPASEIIRVAETSPAAITLLATRGHGGIRRWMLGSVSTEIIQHSHCPILVLPPAAVALQET